MTDPFDPLDELASAYLDGEATPDGVARVESDPAALARVDTLREVREAVQALGSAPVDRAARNAAIAAAVAAYDGPTEATVTSLTDVAARRRRLSQRGRLVGVAAAVALVAALIPAVSRLGDSSGDDAATAARDDDQSETLAIEEDAGPFAADGGGAQAERSSDDMAAGTTSLAALSDLGALPDLPALAAAVRTALDNPEGAGLDAVAPSTPEREVCLTAARYTAATAGTTLLLTAAATVADRPVLATVTAELDGTRVLTVVDPAASCVLVTREVL